MNDVPFKFPVLQIPEPNDRGAPDILYVHTDDSNFVVGDKKHREERHLVGHLIFDALGRSWRLNDMVDLGPGDTFLNRLCSYAFKRNDIRYDLSDELQIPFADIKGRVLAVISADPGAYSRGEYALETYDASKTDEELVEAFLAQVRSCERPLELIAAIHFHDFV